MLEDWQNMVIPVILDKTKEEAIHKLNLLGNVAPILQLDIADGLLIDDKTFTDISFLNDLNITAKIQLHLIGPKTRVLFTYVA